jgi:hypothetical protein
VEASAWAFFTSALDYADWVNCNHGVDPCTACVAPDSNDTDVECALFGRSSLRRDLSGLEERHVISIVLRNAGLQGVLSSDALNSFSELAFVDLSGNNITLPEGELCAMINACVDPAAGCDLGIVALCDSNGNPQGSSPNTAFEFTGTVGYVLAILAGVALSIALVAIIITFSYNWYYSVERKAARKEMRREARLARRRLERERRRQQQQGTPGTPNRLQRISQNIAAALPIGRPPGLGSPPSPGSLANRMSVKFRNIPITPFILSSSSVPPPPGPPPGHSSLPKLPPARRKKSRYQPPQLPTNDKTYDLDRPRSSDLRNLRPVDSSLAWAEAVDPNSGNMYWINHITGQFSWTPPIAPTYTQNNPYGGAPGGFGAAPATPQLERLGVSSSNGAWEEVFDAPTGQTVWVNPTNGLFSWVRRGLFMRG